MFFKLSKIFSRVSCLPGRGFCSNFTSISDEKELHQKFIDLYMKYLNLTKVEATAFLHKNPVVWGGSKSYKDVESTLKYLSKKYSSSEIISRPTTLLLQPSVFENRNQVMHECKFHKIQLFYCIKYVSLMNRNVLVLKAYDFIHPGSDVIANLKKQLDVPVDTYSEKLTEEMPLNEIRGEIMNWYLQDKLQMTGEEIKKTRSVYKNLKHRSLRSIRDVIQILQSELNFTSERIIKNGYLLHARPENIKAIIHDIPRIGGVDIREILHTRPKIMMQTAENISATIEHIKFFNISEASINKCLDVLTLSSDTVYARLAELNKIKEFSVMISNPRILRLIHYQTKAKARLECLKQLKMRCFSLSVLSGPTDIFEKYAFLGVDQTKGKDVVEYLNTHLNVPHNDIRATLHTHPCWIKVPILSIEQTMQFLAYKNFSKQDLIENLIILLYPVKRIQHKLNMLKEWKEGAASEYCELSGIDVSLVSNSKLLSLCLYLIEAEYHFTGDAVFELDNKGERSLPPELPKNLIEKKYRFRSNKKVAL